MIWLTAFVCVWTILPTICHKVDCPFAMRTKRLDDQTCLHMAIKYPPEHPDGYKGQRSFAWSESRCTELGIGDLNWNLPKIDTPDKRKKFIVAFNQMLESNRISRRTLWENSSGSYVNGMSGAPYVWLGLRRDKQKRDVGDWSDEKYWHWTRDKSDVWIRRLGYNDLWAPNQPDNELQRKSTKEMDLSEECAIAKFEEAMWKQDILKLMYFSRPCELPDSLSDKAMLYNFARAFVICEGVAQKSTSFLDTWAFYVVCAALVVVPVISLLILMRVLHRKSRRRSTKNYQKRTGKKASGTSSTVTCRIEQLDGMEESFSMDFPPPKTPSKWLATSKKPASEVSKTPSVINAKKVPSLVAAPSQRPSIDRSDDNEYSNVVPKLPRPIIPLAPLAPIMSKSTSGQYSNVIPLALRKLKSPGGKTSRKERGQRVIRDH